MGLFSKVFRAVFGQSDDGKTQDSTDFEKQVRKDGVAHAGKRIAEELTERMEILTARTGTKVKELAKQFVLEELDAARHGDEFAQNFARESGYKPSEYIGAMEETKWKGEESELEHLQLFVRVFTSKISDPTVRVKLSIAIVDEFMKHWKLGKYKVVSENNQGHRDAIAGYSRFCEGIEDSEFEDENYEDNDFDDSDNELRLIDVVKKISNLHEGVFANINNNLGEHFSQGNVSRSSPIILMAYAYARRTAAAGLFLQGVFDRGTYKIASSTFTAMQLHTGHTVEFQEEAGRQAEELLVSYDSRLDKLTSGLITMMVEQYKTPERYDGKNHIPYEVAIAALQYTINENNPCPLSGQIFPKQ